MFGWLRNWWWHRRTKRIRNTRSTDTRRVVGLVDEVLRAKGHKIKKKPKKTEPPTDRHDVDSVERMLDGIIREHKNG